MPRPALPMQPLPCLPACLACRPKHTHHTCLPALPFPAEEVEDVYAGLVGALVIGRKGELKEDLTAKDVDRWVGGCGACLRLLWLL